MGRYTREEWERCKASFPLDQQYQWYPPPLYIAKWRELPGIFLYYLIGAIIGIIGIILLMWLFGTIVDNAGERFAEHTRCLKHATNGYEIEKCK